MTNPMITIHDLETNEIIHREMTEAELQQYEIDVQAELNRKQQEAAKAAARQAVLSKLGLTAEEAAALLA